MSIREKVEEILRDYPNTRNDDKDLLLTYWKKVNKLNFKDMNLFLSDFRNNATYPESIRRARQLIQEEGMYLPTDGVIVARRRKQERMKYAIKSGEVV